MRRSCEGRWWEQLGFPPGMLSDVRKDQVQPEGNRLDTQRQVAQGNISWRPTITQRTAGGLGALFQAPQGDTNFPHPEAIQGRRMEEMVLKETFKWNYCSVVS